MKILIEESVLRQALEALSYSEGGWAVFNPVITALRSALDASEGVEPVAWMFRDDPAVFAYAGSGVHVGKEKPDNALDCIPLYTHPAPAVPDDELRAELDAMSKRLYEAEAAELQWLTYRHVVDRVEDLEKQLAACQKDAERYKMHVKLWSASHGVPEDEVTRELDAAIDEAMKGDV